MLDSLEFEKLLTEMKAKNRNDSINKILYELKNRDVSIMTAIKIVYCLTDKSLGQSKEYVSYHPAWQAVCEKSKQFHKELEDSIYEIMEA